MSTVIAPCRHYIRLSLRKALLHRTHKIVRMEGVVPDLTLRKSSVHGMTR